MALLEPGTQGTRNARARGIEYIVNAAFQDVHFPTGSLPAAGLFDVLEHVEAPGDFLKELKRTITPGGMLYLTVPAHGWLWSDVDIRAGHFQRYSACSVARLLTAHGFSVNYITYVFSYLTAPLFALKTIPYRLKIKRKTALSAIQAEHQPGKGIQCILDVINRYEVARVRQKRRIPIGSSVLLAAHATP